MASETSINADKAIYVAKCESGLDPHARGDMGHSRGIYQIDDIYHPEVSTKQAESPVWATAWALNEMQAGKWSDWKTCSKRYDSM